MANSYTAPCPFCQASAIREGELRAKLEAERKAREKAEEKYCELIRHSFERATNYELACSLKTAEAALAKVRDELEREKLLHANARDALSMCPIHGMYSTDSGCPQCAVNRALAPEGTAAGQDTSGKVEVSMPPVAPVTAAALPAEIETPRTDALESFDRAERHKALWDLCAELERELADSRQLLNAYQRWLKEAEAIADHKRAKAWQEIVHMPAKPSIAIPVLDLDRDKNASLSDAKSLLRDTRRAVAYAANNTTSQLWRNELDDLLARIDASVKEGE